jgi:hypothetical protein
MKLCRYSSHPDISGDESDCQSACDMRITAMQTHIFKMSPLGVYVCALVHSCHSYTSAHSYTLIHATRYSVNIYMHTNNKRRCVIVYTVAAMVDAVLYATATAAANVLACICVFALQ